MKTSKEVKIDLCANHKDSYLEDFYPGYIFNPVIIFPPRECRIPGCAKDAYYQAIGVTVPDSVGDLTRSDDEKLCRATYEIYREAKQLLDGTTAKDRLSYYLQSRIVPSSHRELLATRMINKFADLILEKLKIDPENSLSDRDKHRILLELNLYPEEYK